MTRLYSSTSRLQSLWSCVTGFYQSRNILKIKCSIFYRMTFKVLAESADKDEGNFFNISLDFNIHWISCGLGECFLAKKNVQRKKILWPIRVLFFPVFLLRPSFLVIPLILFSHSSICSSTLQFNQTSDLKRSFVVLLRKENGGI